MPVLEAEVEAANSTDATADIPMPDAAVLDEPLGLMGGVSLNRKALTDAVDTASRCADSRSALPILSCVLLEPAKMPDGSPAIRVQASNNDAWSESLIPGDIPGPAAIDAKELLARLKALPGDTVTIEPRGGHKFYLSGGTTRYSLQGMNPEEMPAVPSEEAAWVVDVAAEDIARIFDQTLFACSTDETRIQYTGVLLEPERRTLRAVATDGQVRVSAASCPVKDPQAEDLPSVSGIIPRSTIREAMRLFRKGDVVQVAMGTRLVVFRSPSGTITSRMIDGAFAAWRRVVPNDSPTSAVFRSNDLSAAIARVMLTAKQDQNRVLFKIGEGRIALSATAYGDEAEDAVDAATTGDPVEVAMSGLFIREMITHSGAESIRLGASAPLTPVVLTAANDKAAQTTDDPWIAVQSPMHAR